jgi:diguanylate cyclase (GGDEF)-like protein
LQSQESVAYLEDFDRLTALPNRSLYVRRLAGALDEALGSDRRLALLVLDISDLGMINDGLGHHAGDLLLQLVAERLKNEFRDTNRMCRLGGDRFAVLAVGSGSDITATLKEQVACLFDAPFSIHDRELRVSIRAGLAQSPDDGVDAEALLQYAQTAVEHAKQAGEQYLRHQPNMNTKASEQLSLINALRYAVAERKFVLAYQPKVDARSRLVDGVEALLRWPDSERGPIPPNVFVPMLESLGLIDEVGSWVVVQALAEAAEWFALAGDDFRVAVNVSPLQLSREDFAERILRLAAAVPNGPQRLELEVTESTLMADPRRASANLKRLREAGVSIAIDDFGTGHSSLRVLAGLPVDVLKIDRSFVRDIATNRGHRVIVQTTITLADSLGLKTVAEGVETQEQAQLLAELGCQSLQGYLVCRPESAGQIAEWLSANARSAASLGAAPRADVPLAQPPPEPTARTRYGDA